MSPPTWLPPLHSHADYTTTIAAEQLDPPTNTSDSSLSEPVFEINLLVSVRFYSHQDKMLFEGYGSFLCGMFSIPCSKLTDSSPKEAQELISSMLSMIGIPFEINSVDFFKKQLDGVIERKKQVDSNWVEILQDFLRSMMDQSYNVGHKILPVTLAIRKLVSISDFEYKSWSSWYAEKKRNDPDFERDYKAAISRHRTADELLLYEACYSTSKVATQSSIAALEGVKLEDSSRCSKVECSVCLEELVLGSEATRLPCSHLFHRDCIVMWLQESHVCPLCRFGLPTA